MLRTRTIFNDIDQSVKLYDDFSFQGNVLRKLSIFFNINVMQHLVPHGDFSLDVEGRFANKVATPRSPIDEYSFRQSENDKPEES